MLQPRSHPFPLGVRLRGGAAHVAVVASRADAVEFCLLRPRPGGGWSERRVPLTERTHGVWHGVVDGVDAGQRYGFRAHGPWETARGLRHNPAKLLLDPYARALAFPDPGLDGSATRLALRPELFGHRVDDRLTGDTSVPDDRDSLAFAPHGVLLPEDDFDWRGVPRPDVPLADTVVYEVHVRGFTATMPRVPAAVRGTYAGMGHPAAVAHLQRLGVTAVELLPVHAIADEVHLARAGRVNYWGYNTLGYFTPHPGYAATDDPAAVRAEFQTMVRTLHEAGIEVLLDVVYNHTCEGGTDGPTLSWRGLDAPGYYRLDAHGAHVDTTGCGNSLDFSQARVVQLALDSMRYWVEVMGVDGFRFDLATTLARGRTDDYDPDHPLLVAMRADPVVATVKLIAEPWDVGYGGWRTGQFPTPFAEWNDAFRDGVRDYWLVGAARMAHGQPGGGVRDLATRLAGSADVFAPSRGPLASVNFVTAHDGFTVADLVAYDVKHNEANGEGNRDGTDNNRSYNHGVEGVTDDPQVSSARRRAIRNLLGTLLLATGVPMLVAGDEFGRSQGGNNNAYSTDDATTWLDWDLATWQRDLLQTVGYLVRLRREHPVLGQAAFFAGRPQHGDGTKDLAWFRADGAEMDHDGWYDLQQRILLMYLHAVVRGPDGRHVDGSLLVIIQAAEADSPVRLPGAEWGRRFDLVWDSAFPLPPGTRGGPPAATEMPHASVLVTAQSIRLYRVPPAAEPD